jgi:ABC-type branched-subunit amino acid transport system substrate-binding protein
MTGPFTGPARELGREMKVGINTYFHHINEHGGVAGRKLHLIDLDDGYEPDRALANMRELHEQRKVFAIIGNVGTPTTEKALPYVRAKKLLFFGAFTGANLLRRDPPDRYVFNCRASYEEETAAIVKYFVEVRQILPAQIAVFAQKDAYGDDAFAGVVKRLQQYGRDPKDILRVGYDRNTLLVNDAVQTILLHPEVRAIVMVPTYKPAAAFVRKVKDARPEMLFASVSFVGSEALAEALVERGPQYADGVMVAQVVPPIDSGSTLVTRYRELLKKHHPSAQPSATSLEGYITAAVFVEGVRKAGPRLTTEGLIDALESIRNLDLGTGAPISFGPSEHQASHKVWGIQLDKEGRFTLLEQFK